MSDNLNIFWFSSKQRDTMAAHGDRSLKYFESKDGRILRYTEWKKNRTPSNFDDAVCLGEGKFHHIDKRG